MRRPGTTIGPSLSDLQRPGQRGRVAQSGGPDGRRPPVPQALSTRPDLLPQDYLTEFEQLQARSVRKPFLETVARHPLPSLPAPPNPPNTPALTRLPAADALTRPRTLSQPFRIRPRMPSLRLSSAPSLRQYSASSPLRPSPPLRWGRRASIPCIPSRRRCALTPPRAAASLVPEGARGKPPLGPPVSPLHPTCLTRHLSPPALSRPGLQGRARHGRGRRREGAAPGHRQGHGCGFLHGPGAGYDCRQGGDVAPHEPRLAGRRLRSQGVAHTRSTRAAPHPRGLSIPPDAEPSRPRDIHLLQSHAPDSKPSRNPLFSPLGSLQVFLELDYIHEGRNAERFAALYGDKPDVLVRREPLALVSLVLVCSVQLASAGAWRTASTLRNRNLVPEVFGICASPLVQVPQVYWHASSARVLTMEWVVGTKLSDLESLKAQARAPRTPVRVRSSRMLISTTTRRLPCAAACRSSRRSLSFLNPFCPSRVRCVVSARVSTCLTSSTSASSAPSGSCWRAGSPFALALPCRRPLNAS